MQQLRQMSSNIMLIPKTKLRDQNFLTHTHTHSHSNIHMCTAHASVNVKWIMLFEISLQPHNRRRQRNARRQAAGGRRQAAVQLSWWLPPPEALIYQQATIQRANSQPEHHQPGCGPLFGAPKATAAAAANAKLAGERGASVLGLLGAPVNIRRYIFYLL